MPFERSFSAPRRAVLGVGLVAALSLSVAGSLRGEARRGTLLAGFSAPDAVLAAVPVADADFAAAPQVTSPTATVASFALPPLRAVAAVVLVRQVHTVRVARLGGLHGP